MSPEASLKPYDFLCRTWQLLQGISTESSPELSKIGLYPRAFFLLAQVERCPHPAQLAEALLLPAPTVSFIVRQLEKGKLISRSLDRSDLRRYKLALTKKGEEAVRQAKIIMEKVAEKRLSRLSLPEQAKLSALLAALCNGDQQ